MEEVFYEKLELRKEGGRMNNLEHLGQAMTDAGNEFGAGTPYGWHFFFIISWIWFSADRLSISSKGNIFGRFFFGDVNQGYLVQEEGIPNSETEMEFFSSSSTLFRGWKLF